MPDLTVSEDVDAMLAAANNAAIRTAIGVPATSHTHSGADITSGDIAALYINAALTAPGPIGSVTPGTVAATTLTTTGNVGIGTSGPTSALQLNGTTEVELSIGVAGSKRWALSQNVYTGGNSLDLMYVPSTTPYLTFFTDGNISIGISTLGTKLSIKGGLQVGGGTALGVVKHGVAVLVAGTVTVSDAATVETGTAATNSRIYVNRMTDGGTVGDSYSVTRTDDTSFTITSMTANAAATSDTSTVSWLMINP